MPSHMHCQKSKLSPATGKDNIDSRYPKFVKLNNWNWRENFGSLEEATEFLLNYCRELGPLSEECLQRLNKNAETIRKLTLINKQLRKGIANEANQHRKPF